MLQLRSIINAADNTGAKKLSVVQVYGDSRRKFAYIGDVVLCVVKEADPESLAKQHSLVKAVIVRTKKECRRKDGSYIRFDDNAAIIIDNPEDKNPLGSRVFGPICRELKDLGYNKIISMAQEVY